VLRAAMSGAWSVVCDRGVCVCVAVSGRGEVSGYFNTQMVLDLNGEWPLAYYLIMFLCLRRRDRNKTNT
jgi:hypothetical protein